MNPRTTFQILAILMLIVILTLAIVPFTLSRLFVTPWVMVRIAQKAYRDGIRKWDLNH